MIALSLPFWLQAHPEDDGRGIKTGLAGIGTLPDDAQSKQAFDLIVRVPEGGLASLSRHRDHHAAAWERRLPSRRAGDSPANTRKPSRRWSGGRR